MWVDQVEHRAWLSTEFGRLLSFGERSARPGGGAETLRADGSPEPGAPLMPYHTARVAHAFGLATLAGVPGARPVAEAVLSALHGVLRDDRHGGWFHRVGPEDVDSAKDAYDHVHVLLAASTGLHAGLAGADTIFEEASRLVGDVFWDERLGLLADGFTRDFAQRVEYIGANANMHGLEAMLAAHDASGDVAWLRRGLRIAEFFTARAAEHDGRLPEHYRPDAGVDLDYNADRPGDQFKPYGATIGHGLEWSRLLLHLEAALVVAGMGEGPWLLDAARLQFDRAVADGWDVDGAPGFVYTTDFSGRPVVRSRLWWVAAEGVCAASAFWRRTGEQRYADLYARWWDFIATRMRDLEGGSWHHCLDADNRPDATIWQGKPDLYHTVQSTLIPRLPLAPGLAAAVAGGL